MNNLNTLDWVSLILVIIGGINWGLIGAFQFDVVSVIFGKTYMLARLVYLLVGLASLYLIFTTLKLSGKTK